MVPSGNGPANYRIGLTEEEREPQGEARCCFLTEVGGRVLSVMLSVLRRLRNLARILDEENF